MTTRKTTKKALLGSFLALVLCFAMLVGTTFAWFTDNEVLTNNKILAGTLDIELDSETPLFSYVNLWEPGVSEPASTVLKNVGNLWLKYTFSIDNVVATDGEYSNASDSDGIANDGPDGSNLAEVLEVYVGTTKEDMVPANYLGTLQDLIDADDFGIQDAGILEPGKSAPVELIIHMMEEAGNEYMNDSITFDVSIFATQYTKETDGFGDDQYDAAAPMATQAQINELAKTLANAKDGDTIELAAMNYGNLTLGSGAYPYDYPANLTLVGQEGTAFTGFSVNDENISGWTFQNITFDGNSSDNAGNTDGIAFSTKATVEGLTIDNCNFINGANLSMINTSGTTFKDVVVKNSTFSEVGEGPAILLQGVENITVDGCTFTNAGYNAIQTNKMTGDVFFTNNTITNTTDRAIRFSNNGANITITGNTVVSQGDADGELLKSSGTNGTITLSGNTWNGKADAEMNWDGTVLK